MNYVREIIMAIGELVACSMIAVVIIGIGLSWIGVLGFQ